MAAVQGPPKCCGRNELALHIAVTAVFYVGIFWFSYEASEPFSDAHERPKLRGLVTSWLFPSRFVDVRDTQWRMFRQQLPLLCGGAAVYLALRHLTLALAPTPPHTHHPSHSTQLLALNSVAVVCVLFVHGSGCVFLFAIVFANFRIAKRLCGTRLLVPFTWICGMLILYLNERYGGYRVSWVLGQRFAWVDAYKGLYSWHQGFKFVFLRLVSFNVDLHWATAANGPKTKEYTPFSYEWRAAQHHPPSCYSGGAYVAFLFYLPLLLAGPICSFNAFLSQLHSPQRTYSPAGTALYGARWAFDVVVMEAMSSHIYCWAINASPGYWETLDLVHLFSVSFCTLNVMWLKFLIIWRFFRLWALADGVETPENMPKCVNHHNSLTGFWRAWHHSYNVFLLRYIYFPLGGNRQHKLLNLAVVFTFVALWHDMTFTLLLWSWLTLLFFAPEVLCSWCIKHVLGESVRAKSWWRHVLCLGGAVNIIGLVTANLVGFATGVAGLKRFRDLCAEDPAGFAVFLLSWTFFMWSLSQVMLFLKFNPLTPMPTSPEVPGWQGEDVFADPHPELAYKGVPLDER